MKQFEIKQFRIIDELGRGPQGKVYLADDQNHERQVVIKVMDIRGTPRDAHIANIIAEINKISRLQHPNILAIYEAGEYLDSIFIAFEYLKGIFLDELIRKNGSLDARYAARLMAQVLRGLNYAHELGILHGDLKPSNILIGPKDIPKITDFRITSLTGTENELPGTYMYMSPEHFSKERLGPHSDLFSLGLIFYEMLVGKPAFEASSNAYVQYKIEFDAIDAPSKKNDSIDAGLDYLVLRALEKNPDDRFGSAFEMMQEMDDYLSAERREGILPSWKMHSTVSRLVHRMYREKDFPAFSQHIAEINQKATAANTSSTSALELANAILKDYAMTCKLLRLVNSAFYGQRTGKISTISRAVVVLGFEQVRLTALSLMLFDQLKNRGQVAELKESAISAFMRGLIARKLADLINAKAAEVSCICAMLHNLGEHLVIFYLNDDYQTIKKIILEKSLTEKAASASVLQISYEDLAKEVLKIWEFPDNIINSMNRLPEGKVLKPKTDDEVLQILANYSNELCNVVKMTEKDDRSRTIDGIANRFSDCILLTEPQINDILVDSREKIMKYADILGVDPRKSELLRRMGDTERSVPTGREIEQSVKKQEDQAASLLPTKEGEGGDDVLIAGIDEVSSVLLGEAKLNDILFMILETMYVGFEFRRIVFCVADNKQSIMNARYAFGDDTRDLINRFSFKITPSSDLFNRAISENQDMIIPDIDDPSINKYIPEWYRDVIGAPSFVVCPIIIRKKPIGMFYADRDHKGEILSGNHIHYMKILRNFAVLAIGQIRR